ncbi:snakin-2-like [Andrographis paniculata]|uniref:snakin-2-like n=1 Tax=Andrographis paniculata TaxID=175694 RepID=UPI0021E92045|nr:snakin-2-like [Andrographis paniculata]
MMAFPKVVIAPIFILLVILHHQVHAVQIKQEASNVVSESSYSPEPDCGRACAARCRLSSRPRLCKRACGTCCMRCKCVPPGTYGNLDLCPCYANMTTRNNKRKCP